MSVKWGVLGTCELYAIAGRNETKVKSYKDEFGFAKAYVGYEKLLEDPEVQAVYIPLPNSLHKEWVIRALKAGKNVLCEKPMALNTDDAREMFAFARENNVILMEAYAYLHSPYIASLRADIDSGIIGDVDYIETAFVTQGYVDDIRLYKELGGGAIYDLGCYCTTMILSMIDSDVDYVMVSSALIKFKNGVRADFNVGMIFNPGANGRWDRLFIHGNKGTITSAVEYNQAGDLTYEITANGEKITRTVNARWNYTLETEQLGRCIEEGEKPFISPEFSIRNAELLDQILAKAGY